MSAIDKAALQQKDLASLVGTSPSVITDTLKGRRRPPLDQVAKWADALKITGENRAKFIEAAHLAHAPEEIGALVRRLRLAVLKQGDEIDGLRAQLAQLATLMRQKGFDVPKGIGDV